MDFSIIKRTKLRIFSIFVILAIVQQCASYLKYTEQSCSDLTPRSFDEFTNVRDTYSSIRRIPIRKRKRSQYGEDVPFKLTLGDRRYRRDTDFIVNIEGGEFDGVILQARSTPGSLETSYTNVVGLVGQFRFIRFPFKYLLCYDIPYATVVDQGHPLKLGNISFVWRAPEQDAGDVHFVASISKGNNYWVVQSDSLTFNPFPISSYSCGSTLACFRICSFGQYACTPREAIYVLSYYADFREKREIEFTMGGIIPNNNSYIAVALGEDFDNLSQSDLVVCYLDNGMARIDHLLIENLFLPPYVHTDVPIEVEDYDLDGNMLWCKFRRPINPGTIINGRQNLYHFHFRGSMDHFPQRFILPRRKDIYASQFLRNFTTPYNEILSASFLHQSSCSLIGTLALLLFFVVKNF